MPTKLDRMAVCRSWGPYVRHMADLLWLRDWTIELVPEPPDGEDSRAEIYPTPGRRLATLSLSDEFLDDADAAAQRHTVVHELIHLHFEPALVMAERAMGRRWEDFRMALEYGVDATADAFAARLPLPSEFKPRRERSTAMAKVKNKKGKDPMPKKGKVAKPKGGKKMGKGDCY